MVTKPSDITDSTFVAEVIEGSNTQPVLVDFWAAWCGPCKMVAPVLEQIQEEQEGKLRVVKVDVDDNQQVASKYGVMSIPTIILFKGGSEVKRIVGFRAKEFILSQIGDYIKVAE
ncbi:MAG: thioredoxin [Chloroflexi bacterium]|nr:thioredoxin [Chloroflexota bacterium]